MRVSKVFAHILILVLVKGAPRSEQNNGDKQMLEILGPFDELTMEQRSVAKNLKSSFDELDKILRNKTNGFDRDANISAAKEMLKMSGGKWKDLFFVDKIQKALKMFTSLDETTKSCNLKSYEVLATNFVANQGQLYESITRTVLDGYAKIHASNCLLDYEENLELTMMQDDWQECLARINDVLFGLEANDVLIGGYRASQQQLPRTALISSSIGGFKIQDSGIEKILRNIESLVANTPEADSFYAQRDKEFNFYPAKNFTKIILMGYILEPCKQYVDYLRDFFAPARLDMFTASSKQSLVPPGETTGLLLDTWAKYRICLYLTRADFSMVRPKFERVLMQKIGIKPEPKWW